MKFLLLFQRSLFNSILAMKEILWILVALKLLHDDVISSVSASSSYFKITYGKDTGKGSLKKEFYQCDRNAYCTNVVKTKDGKYATVNSESELKELKDVSCVWKKISRKFIIRLFHYIFIKLLAVYG